MVYGRDRSKVTLLTDSGGFQIIDGNKKFMAWNNFQKLKRQRQENLEWQMETGELGTIIDVPLGAIKGNAFFRDPGGFERCLTSTVENIEHFVTHRINNHPFLNVMHGRNGQECDDWYAAVNLYPLEGWAFGGEMKANLYLLIRQLLIIMADGGLTEGKQDWIHLFGTAIPRDAIHFTQIKRQLRKHNPKIEVSFDTATYSKVTGKPGLMLATDIDTPRKAIASPWGPSVLGSIPAPKTVLTQKTLSDLAERAKANFQGYSQQIIDPWDVYEGDFEDTMSPILSGLTYDELIVEWAGGERGWDAISYQYLMMHNLYLELEEKFGANYMFYTKNKYGPQTRNIKAVNDVIEQVFDAPNPLQELRNQKHWL